jgi:PTH1 family peptidyl-tRNA hydrolase
VSHVLGDFDRQDRDWLVALLDAVADNAATLVEGHEAKFQSHVHLAVNPPGSSVRIDKKE